jgi:nucleoside-diphosphate-sugar epimerase
MKIAITGASGFIGRHLANHFAEKGHTLRAWHRAESKRDGFDQHSASIEWIEGDLEHAASSADSLMAGCDAVVHAALWRPGKSFRGGEGDVVRFVEVNMLGSLHLIEAAMRAGVKRFVFLSSCAVHEQILDDRMLDEAHPAWPKTHYGALKAAIESFVYSYGLGKGFPICSLRPTGVYGLAHPISESKWYPLILQIVRDEEVDVEGGGKEVHVSDVAKATQILLEDEERYVIGQSFNCYDQYISLWDVARFAKMVSGSRSRIFGEPSEPKHQIVTEKLYLAGLKFGGRRLFEDTIRGLVQHAQQNAES